MSTTDARERLHRSGLKATQARLLIIGMLREPHRQHLTVEAIWRALRDAGHELHIATAYRAMTQLEQAGIVQRHLFADGDAAVYELADKASHDHMFCLDTRRIMEFQDERIAALMKDIAQRDGYDMEGHSVVLYVRQRRR